ncbi:MAG: hypothetical protein NTU69_10700 [Proteobacteria bacterium]|jgi:hypothetical protein|nr:hypothetical protein [Pseudomonadota bacterium]
MHTIQKKGGDFVDGITWFIIISAVLMLVVGIIFVISVGKSKKKD